MSEWINVKERLPEDDEDVLVYNWKDGISTGHYNEQAVRWYTESDGSKSYSDTGWFTNYSWAPSIDPTHWMTFPEPQRPSRVFIHKQRTDMRVQDIRKIVAEVVEAHVLPDGCLDLGRDDQHGFIETLVEGIRSYLPLYMLREDKNIQWVSVKDRLPHPFELVWIHWRDREVLIGYRTYYGEDEKTTDPAEGWFSFEDGKCRWAYYWSPINEDQLAEWSFKTKKPEPPKQCICGGEEGIKSGLPRTSIFCPKCDK